MGAGCPRIYGVIVIITIPGTGGIAVGITIKSFINISITVIVDSLADLNGAGMDGGIIVIAVPTPDCRIPTFRINKIYIVIPDPIRVAVMILIVGLAHMECIVEHDMRTIRIGEMQIIDTRSVAFRHSGGNGVRINVGNVLKRLLFV